MQGRGHNTIGSLTRYRRPMRSSIPVRVFQLFPRNPVRKPGRCVTSNEGKSVIRVGTIFDLLSLGSG